MNSSNLFDIFRLFAVGFGIGAILSFAPWAVGYVIQMFKRVSDPDMERKD